MFPLLYPNHTKSLAQNSARLFVLVLSPGKNENDTIFHCPSFTHLPFMPFTASAAAISASLLSRSMSL